MTSLQSARIIGMLTFFVGVGLLVAVFFLAMADLKRPLAETGNATVMGMALISRIGLLFVMGLAGSIIAGRGVQLYQAGIRKPDVIEVQERPEAPPPEV
ncbi:MAG: hypothetical protein KY468_07890 [Armatimonadetes bacterium]|nr:hypothetical protein [Armatimonadota bacterium]